MSESNLTWFDERLEAYVDGDLDYHDRRRMDELARGYESAERQLRLARMVKSRLSEMPWEACPPDVTRAVLQLAAEEARRSTMHRFREAMDSIWATFLRPSLAVATLVVLIVFGARLGSPPAAQTEEVAASPEEVEQALQDVKWTLAFLSEVGRKTGQSIRHDVLEERVARPMRESISTAFDAPAKSRDL